ncbi:uncharacterized protein LOC119100387 [Pollicipes pollicipes]|uniref:uncharacterized protein LOC119100387 n=1 Tax=Pollicipes pollicipes TaxID=41117 RepID=UPI001884EFB5|nr:uncharacterized protein LOC119100387 [Pollicipes pollicipes]
MFRDEKKWGLTTVEDGMTAERLSDLARKQTHPNKLGDRYPVPCYPLYSILLALGRTSVDFLSLDVEGTEMGILAHVPWHLVDIKILLVENFMTYLWNPQTDMMRWFMESRGYLAMRLQHDWCSCGAIATAFGRHLDISECGFTSVLSMLASLGPPFHLTKRADEWFVSLRPGGQDLFVSRA